MDEGTKLPYVPRDRSYYSTRALKYTQHPAGPRTGSLDSLSLRRRRSAAAGPPGAPGPPGVRPPPGAINNA